MSEKKIKSKKRCLQIKQKKQLMKNRNLNERLNINNVKLI